MCILTFQTQCEFKLIGQTYSKSTTLWIYTHKMSITWTDPHLVLSLIFNLLSLLSYRTKKKNFFGRSSELLEHT